MARDTDGWRYDFEGMIDACLASEKLNEASCQHLVDHALAMQEQHGKLSLEDYFFYAMGSAWLFRSRGWKTEISQDGIVTWMLEGEAEPFRIPRGNFDHLVEEWLAQDGSVQIEIAGREDSIFWPLNEYRRHHSMGQLRIG